MKTTQWCLSVVAVLCFVVMNVCAQGVLVAHWRMDEAPEAETLLPATGVNSITLKNGAKAGVDAVDGSGVAMTAGAGQIVDSTMLIPATDDFGVFMWIAFTNISTETSQMHLFSCNAGQANRANFMILDSGDRIGWFHSGGQGRTGAMAINDGAWHHVGITRRNGRMQLWVDGLPDSVESAVTAAPISQEQDWRIGSFVSEEGGLFYGRMDDLRIYHGALTDGEIASVVADCVPVQAEYRWRLDEGSGATLFAPDNGWMAAVALKAPVAGVRAPQGTGIELDGQNLLRVPASRFLIPATNDFSVFLWTRDDAATASTVQYLSNNSGPTQVDRCSFGNTFSTTTTAGQLFFFHPDATFAGETSVRDAGWHHVGLVRRGNVIELWLDGDLDGSRDYGAGFTLSQAYDWRVGAAAMESGNFLTGRLDDLRIYTNALVATEVSTLYDSYTPTNALVAHWTFNDAANKQILEPSVGWRDIQAINTLQSGAAGVDATGLWANSTSRGRILGSKKLIPATSDFTVLLWIRTKNTTPVEKHLFTNNRSQAGRCNLTMDAAAGNNKLTWWVNNTYGLVSVGAGSGPVVDDGAWHQVGISRSGKTFQLWVDGVNVNSATSGYAGIPAVTQSNDWFIASSAHDGGGAHYGAVGTGYALMDDLRVYSYALDVTTVSGLYNAFKPLPTGGTPSAPTTDHALIETATGGKVVAHLATITGESDFHMPSLVVGSDGSYRASATVLSSPLGVHTKIFESSNQGSSWTLLSAVTSLYGGTLFENSGALYLIGNTYDGGAMVIRRSSNGGSTWSTPATETSGILTTNTGWNFRGGSVTVHDGRVWVYVERRGNTARGGYPSNVEAGVLSAPVNADLLNAANWAITEPLTTIPESWDPSVNIRGWSNGRTVVDKEGQLRLAMTVASIGVSKCIALLSAGASPDAALTHVPLTDTVLLPGGWDPFAILYDPLSRRFWAVTNPNNVKQMGLFSSFTLADWAFHTQFLVAGSDTSHSFTVPDAQIVGDDLIVLCRAAYADQDGAATTRNHLLFNRIENFRQLAMDKQPGRLLAADSDNACVRRYSFGAENDWLFDDGAEKFFARGVYAGQPLTAPYGLARSGGRVYVSEHVAGGRVLAFSTRGSFRGVVQSFGAECLPGSLAASESALFVSDETGNKVWRVDIESGAASVWIAQSGAGYTLQAVRGLACDGGGNLYVADRTAGLILRFNAAGDFVGSMAQNAPEALLWDAATGRLLVSVDLVPKIVSINPLGGAATEVLGNTIGGQRFCGLATAGGCLYFTSDAKNRVNRQDGPSSYIAADIRVDAPGQLLLVPSGGEVYPEAALGTIIILK